MITHNGKKYLTERRRARKDELIVTLLHLNSDYQEGSVFRVHKEIPELNEVLVYPEWYEDGMNCFGISVFLDVDDYEVMVEITE
ncbi:hypothetical protein [Brevibacillus sp. NRS-1366]|uniref:hypothetical protein n=1 Tax=Brevibacillus sp. NRS-1366 TaxID=3233899 RepID=UPI003D1E99D9